MILGRNDLKRREERKERPVTVRDIDVMIAEAEKAVENTRRFLDDIHNSQVDTKAFLEDLRQRFERDVERLRKLKRELAEHPPKERPNAH